MAGNFTTLDGSSFATYDAANKISSLSGGSISHDSDGNLLSVTSAAIPATSLTWNTRSNLSSLTSGATAVSFTYDTLGRRVRQMQGTAKRFYIFAGDKLLGEIQGSPQVAYTWGPQGLVSERLFQVQYIAVADVYAAPETLAVSAPVSQADDETALSGYAAESAVAEYAVYAIPTYAITLWYHHGPQGETRYLTDPSGNIADTYRYDGYGIPISATNTYYNPHRYGGKYGYHSNLNPTGVILAGHRWYSPQLRRWMSRDPIAYQGGENLYAYVGANPVGFVDPSGLAPDLNLLPISQSLFNIANSVVDAPDDPEVFTIVAHGSPDTITNALGRKYLPDDFARELIEQWGSRLKRAKRIDLYSCQTGQGENSFALRFMRALRSRGVLVLVRVRAPNGFLSLFRNQPTIVTNKSGDVADPQWQDFSP